MTRFITREYSPAIVGHLTDEGFLEPLARVLAARGIESGNDLKADWRAMLPPETLLGTTAAARLLADAIEKGLRIMVIADYDCDGATACAVAMMGLRSMGATVDYLVPDRFVYGYGLTPAIVDLAAQKGAQMILTVDNGMASIDGVEQAKKLGIEVIITDHHLPADTLPAAACIVNPNTPGCDFPSKNLAGVGVMFYVLMALRAEFRRRGRFDARTQPRLDALVDLVALGTVADVVKLDRNNRIQKEETTVVQKQTREIFYERSQQFARTQAQLRHARSGHHHGRIRDRRRSLYRRLQHRGHDGPLGDLCHDRGASHQRLSGSSLCRNGRSASIRRRHLSVCLRGDRARCGRSGRLELHHFARSGHGR